MRDHTLEPCSVRVSECQALSEQCRGSVGAVSVDTGVRVSSSVGTVLEQCRPVSEQCRGFLTVDLLDSVKQCQSVGVSECRSVGVSGSVGQCQSVRVSECRSVGVSRPYEQASRPYELADRMGYFNHQQTIQTACSVLINGSLENLKVMWA